MDRGEVIVLESTESDSVTETFESTLFDGLAEDDIMVIDEDLNTVPDDEEGPRVVEPTEMDMDSKTKAGMTQQLSETTPMRTVPDGSLENNTGKLGPQKNDEIHANKTETIADAKIGNEIKSIGAASCDTSQQELHSNAKLGHIPCVLNPDESEMPLPYSCKVTSFLS